MNDYIQIKKKYLFIFIAVFISVCCVGGYYFWCANHPEIRIQIGNGSTGKDTIKIEAPKITINRNGIADPSASEELKVSDIIMQHEFLCQYVRDNYKTSDLKLDVQVKDNQTILKYYGTATKLDGKAEDFEKTIKCDFALDAEIIHE